MYKRVFLFGLITLASVLVSTGFVRSSKSQNDWELKKSVNGITVYVRQSENSAFKELKAETQIKTSLSSIVALLSDFESYPQWVYKCGKSVLLKKISNVEMIHYQTEVAPWPVDNRDFIVHIKITQDPGTKQVVLESTCLPDYLPALAGSVRIREFKASWTLTPLKNGFVHLEYKLFVDPGGNIPAWLVNLAVVDGPYETTFNMIDRVKNEKYQKADLPFIKEL